MSSLHMTESELAGNLRAVLDKVRQGVEVVIERDLQPVAVIQAPQFHGRDIDECIVSLKARGSHAVPDEDFAKDVQAAIDAHREPMDAPAWD